MRDTYMSNMKNLFGLLDLTVCSVWGLAILGDKTFVIFRY